MPFILGVGWGGKRGSLIQIHRCFPGHLSIVVPNVTDLETSKHINGSLLINDTKTKHRQKSLKEEQQIRFYRRRVMTDHSIIRHNGLDLNINFPIPSKHLTNMIGQLSILKFFPKCVIFHNNIWPRSATTTVVIDSLSLSDAIWMGTMASQIPSLTIVYSTIYSGADQRKHQSSASLAFVRGIYRSQGEFHAQMGSIAESIFIWRCHHVTLCCFSSFCSRLLNIVLLLEMPPNQQDIKWWFV